MQCDFEALVARAARLSFANINTRFDSGRMAVAMFVCALQVTPLKKTMLPAKF
jgi:hypothetical protein